MSDLAAACRPRSQDGRLRNLFETCCNHHRGMCPRCEGMGAVTDIALSQLFDDGKSLNRGALKSLGYTAGGWNVRMYAESGFLDPSKPIREYTQQECHDFVSQYHR